MNEFSWFYAILGGGQAFYYLTTAAWPLLSVRTFQWVTGHKTDNWTGRESDHWLLNTVCVLILAVGITLGVSAFRGQPRLEAMVLAIGAIVALTSIDLIYVPRGVIRPIYLLDALAECLLLAGWIAFVVVVGIPG
jgi:hypothetical protein